jgi:hypothetical protein
VPPSLRPCVEPTAGSVVSLDRPQLQHERAEAGGPPRCHRPASLRGRPGSAPGRTRGAADMDVQPFGGAAGRATAGRRHSRSEHGCKPLFQGRGRERADDPIDLVPTTDHNQQRDRLSAKPCRELGVCVNVDLDHFETPCVLSGELLENGRDHSARSAPGCPEVNHHRYRGTGLRCKCVAVGIDKPRQLRLAFRTARDAAFDRADPIARTTRLARDDGHSLRVGPQRGNELHSRSRRQTSAPLQSASSTSDRCCLMG